MIEIQIMAAFILLGGMLSVAMRNPLKGFAVAFLWIAGVLAGLLLLTVLAEKGRDVLETERARAFFASRAGVLLKASSYALLAAVAAGAIGAFASIFLAQALSGTPGGQLNVMRGLTGASALAAGGAAFYAGLSRR